MPDKIRSFTDLNTWKESHKLAIMVYKATDAFPSKEVYSLTDQIRRAVVSIGSNIAEGFSRPTSKDKIHFYYISKGSLSELQNQLLLAKDIGYLTRDDFKSIADQTVVVSRLITGMIRAIR